MMTSIFALFNRIVPFADPSRPLWQDVLLSLVLCTVLYIGPQVNTRLARAQGHRLRQPEVAEADLPTAADPAGDEQQPVVIEETVGNVDVLELPGTAQQDPNLDREPDEAQADQAGQAAPTANPHQPRPRDPNREVGAKKAKAIERRNRQRAYNEWLREEGDAQRAEWRRDEAERREQIEAEQRRRADVDAKVREKERKLREARKIKEDQERQAEIEATRSASRMIEEKLSERNFVSISEVSKVVKRDESWLREVVKREGMEGLKEMNGTKTCVMLTKSGWLVLVDAGMMRKAYAQTSDACERGGGRVEWPDFGRSIQSALVAKG